MYFNLSKLLKNIQNTQKNIFYMNLRKNNWNIWKYPKYPNILVTWIITSIHIINILLVCTYLGSGSIQIRVRIFMLRNLEPVWVFWVFGSGLVRIFWIGFGFWMQDFIPAINRFMGFQSKTKFFVILDCKLKLESMTHLRLFIKISLTTQTPTMWNNANLVKSNSGGKTHKCVVTLFEFDCECWWVCRSKTLYCKWNIFFINWNLYEPKK